MTSKVWLGLKTNGGYAITLPVVHEHARGRIVVYTFSRTGAFHACDSFVDVDVTTGVLFLLYASYLCLSFLNHVLVCGMNNP